MAVSYTLLLYLVFTFQLPHLMMSTEHQVRVYMTDVWFLAKKLLVALLDVSGGWDISHYCLWPIMYLH